MVQVAEGAMKEVTNMFQRMRELAVQAISDSNTVADRTALNNEYKQLSDEVKRVAENTQWNGTNILDGARTQTTFQIGANASQTIAVNFGDLATNNSATLAVQAGPTAADTSASTAATASFNTTGTLAAGDTVTMKIDSGAVGYVSFKLDSGAATALNFANGSSDSNADNDGTAITLVGNTGFNIGTITATVLDGRLKVVGATGSETGGDDPTFTVANIETSRGTHAPVGGSDITTSALANTALGVLDTAINNVNSTRAGLGASMSRLEYASDNLQNVAQNTASARSRVMDADYAAETTELARTQIIQQASTAMLAQANQSQQAILALLGA
jgi:flagellin